MDEPYLPFTQHIYINIIFKVIIPHYSPRIPQWFAGVDHLHGPGAFLGRRSLRALEWPAQRSGASGGFFGHGEVVGPGHKLNGEIGKR